VLPEKDVLVPTQLVEPIGIGLMPPGLISVAPNGMPVPPEPVEPSVPSGDVAPMPGVLVRLCA
jgi:hypothetical protein